MTLQAFEPTAPIMSVPVGSGQVERHGVSARSFDAARTRSLTPCCGAWLIRTYGAHAAEFYKEAFGAVELCRIESDDGEVFAEMSIRGARLFVAHESHAHNNFSPEALGGTTVRIDVLSNDPDGMQARAVAVGAEEIDPVGEADVGPRMGRIRDPFGHTWLIGKHWTGARRHHSGRRAACRRNSREPSGGIEDEGEEPDLGAVVQLLRLEFQQQRLVEDVVLGV